MEVKSGAKVALDFYKAISKARISTVVEEGAGRRRLGRDGLAGEGIGERRGEAGAQRRIDDQHGTGTGRGMGQGPVGESCPSICTCQAGTCHTDRGGGRLRGHEGQRCPRGCQIGRRERPPHRASRP